MNSLNIN